MNELRHRVDRTIEKWCAGWIFLGGLAGAAGWNLYKWRQDRALALRLRAEPEPKPSPVSLASTPRVSVLVAAWNEAGLIRAHLDSFLRLRYPNKELVLCAGGGDGSYDMARQYSPRPELIVLEQQPGEGKQVSLRRCLERASGEIIFLTDADCLLDDEAFERGLAPLLLEGEMAATGASRPLRRQLRDPFVIHQWCTDLVAGARCPRFVSGVLGRNCALKREALDRIGGFDPEVHTGTDYYMAKLLIRRGYRIRYVRDSAVETNYPDTLRSYWRRQSRWVRNLMVHGWTFGAYDELGMALRTPVVGLTMLLLPLGALVVGPLALAAWGVLLGYALLARLRYARFARLYRGIDIGARQIVLTPLYVLVDWVAWSMPLLDLLVRRDEW
ncbi:MAG: glycosyltransferase family 2 protein [Thermoflexales bacterium]|nr:glycosyltransferase family 2 protein [Thermoflexales bacterium]